MGGKDPKYQTVYAGEPLQRLVPGGMVFFQRAKIYGGGWWLGYTRTDPPGFEFIFNYPIRMYDGMVWLLTKDSAPSYPSPDDFELTS